jgi:hypothetical protein
VFLYDWLLYGILLKDTFMRVEGYDREMPDMMYLIIGMFVFMAGFTYIYGKGVDNVGSKVQQGIRFGIVIALMVGLGVGLILYSTQEPRPLSDYLIDTVVHIVRFSLAGVIIAYVTGVPGADNDRGKEGGGGGGGGV